MKVHQTDLCIQLGREIKTLRHWMGFNQEDLAKSLNISRSTLVRCEQGKVPFNKKIYDAAKKFLVLHEPSPFFKKPLRSDKVMTTFTSDDREEAYKKKVEEAPYHPGYEDAVVTKRSDPVYKGMDPTKMLWKPKPLSDEEIIDLLPVGEWPIDATLYFARAIEERHGIK